MYIIAPDSTDVTIEFKAVKASDGTPLTGLLYNTAGLQCYWNYTRAAAAQITLAELATPAVTDPHLDGGFIEISSTNKPGVYRLDLPDTVVATATNKKDVWITVSGASDMDPVEIHILLAAFFDPDVDGVNVIEIDGSTVAVAAIKALLESCTIDQVQDLSPRTASSFRGSNSLSSDDDFYNNNLLIFISGNLSGQRADVDNYTGTTRQIDLKSAATEIPAVNDYFILA